MKYIYIFILLLGYNSAYSSMNEDSTKLVRVHDIEFGLNCTGIVNQVLPFANDPSKIGPYTVSFKAMRKKSLLRFNLGMNLNTADQQDYLAASLGFEWRKVLNNKLDWYYAIDGNLFYGSFNYPNEEFSADGGLGLSVVLGLIYYVNDYISISTEGIMFAGIRTNTDNTLVSRILPPLGIFVNLRL